MSVFLRLYGYSRQEISSEAKGLHGEWSIDEGISAAQQKGYYGSILHNAYVPKSQGGYTEIDVIYITCKGIFVFESKNYHGWIFGDAASKNWTLSTRNGEKHGFYNPIMQNEGHIRHLAKYIDSLIPIFSVIAYSDQCEIKKMSGVPDKTYMVNYRNIPLLMQKVWATYPDVMNKEQIAVLFHKLLKLRTTDISTINAHAETVQRISRQQKTVEEGICPCCGGQMKLRTVKKGSLVGQQFWGCSNYPRCSYTRALRER